VVLFVIRIVSLLWIFETPSKPGCLKLNTLKKNSDSKQTQTLITLRYSAIADLEAWDNFRAVSSQTQQ
jgi:hypothetical protein